MFRTDENAAFAVLGLRASMNPYPASSGHLVQNRQQALELGTLRHADAVDKCGDQVVGVLQSRANWGQVLFVDTGAAGEAMCHRIERTIYRLPITFIANQFVIHSGVIFKIECKYMSFSSFFVAKN